MFFFSSLTPVKMFRTHLLLSFSILVMNTLNYIPELFFSCSLCERQNWLIRCYVAWFQIELLKAAWRHRVTPVFILLLFKVQPAPTVVWTLDQRNTYMQFTGPVVNADLRTPMPAAPLYLLTCGSICDWVHTKWAIRPGRECGHRMLG